MSVIQPRHSLYVATSAVVRVSEYLVKWQSLQARVVRTDEECTNGYIHAIDAVLVGPKDVSPPSAAAAASAAQSAAVSALLLTVCGTLLRL